MLMSSQLLDIQALRQSMDSGLKGGVKSLMNKQQVLVSGDGDSMSMSFYPPIAADILLKTLEQCRI